MKLEVNFVAQGTQLFRRAFRFCGNGSVFIQETGLVVEGELLKFWVPMVSRIYQPLLCDRTTRNIPYSQITEYHVSGYWFVFSLLKVAFLVLWFTLAGLLIVFSWSQYDGMAPAALGFSALVVIPIVILSIGRRVHRLTFRLPGGQKVDLAFKLNAKSRVAIETFTQRLNDNRTAAASYSEVIV